MGKYKKCVKDIKEFILNNLESDFYTSQEILENLVEYIDTLCNAPPEKTVRNKLNCTSFREDLKEYQENEEKSVYDLASKYGVTPQAIAYHLRKLNKLKKELNKSR